MMWGKGNNKTAKRKSKARKKRRSTHRFSSFGGRAASTTAGSGLYSRSHSLPTSNAINNVMDSERQAFEGTIPGEKYSLSREFQKFRSPLAKKNSPFSALDYAIVSGDKPGEPCQDDVIATPLKSGKGHVFGVFDGHGPHGHHVSKALSYYVNRMETYKLGHDLLIDTERELPEFISGLNDRISSTTDLEANESGSTATVALLEKNKLHVAWVGDSKAGLFVTTQTDGKFSDLSGLEITKDHDFGSEEEKLRIAANGGEIRKDEGESNVHRLCDPNQEEPYPGIAMSKSIGDYHAMPFGLNCSADYFGIDFNYIKTLGDLATLLGHKNVPNKFFEENIVHATLVMGSDGLWEAMSFREISNFLKPRLRQKVAEYGENSSLNISNDLVVEAKKRTREKYGEGARIDDISAITSILF